MISDLAMKSILVCLLCFIWVIIESIIFILYTNQAIINKPEYIAPQFQYLRLSGIIILDSVLISWSVISLRVSDNFPEFVYLLIALLLMSIIILINDRSQNKISIQFLAQSITVLLGIVFLSNMGLTISENMPFWLNIAIIYTSWMYFICCCKVMDDVDGMLLSQSIIICFAIYIFSNYINQSDLRPI